MIVCGVQHLVIMAEFLMYETQHPIVIIMIIYSSF